MKPHIKLLFFKDYLNKDMIKKNQERKKKESEEIKRPEKLRPQDKGLAIVNLAQKKCVRRFKERKNFL